MENFEKNINLISPIDSIKIMINIFMESKSLIHFAGEYTKKLFENKYFVYFVASKQNFMENILLELDIILNNQHIKDHEIVKIILKNGALINSVPHLINMQLNLIESSKFKFFFSQEQLIKWKIWLEQKINSTHDILKIPMINCITVINKYIDLYKTNQNKCGVYGLGKDYYFYCCEMNTTLPIGTKIPINILLEFAEKERDKLERMIRNIMEKKNPILNKMKFKKILKYIKSKSCYKYNSKEDFIERHQKEINRLHEIYNKFFNYKIKCNFVDIDNNNFHGLYMFDTFFINSTNWMNEITLTTKDLVAHETAPGHHMQITMDKQKQNNRNIFMHYFSFLSNGFCEGWGLFAEKLIPNISEDDFLGIIFGNMHRTIRVTADIMINYLGNDTEEVYKLYKHNTLLTKKEIYSEIRRIQVMPGQVLCYKLGDQVFRKIFIKKLSKHEPLFSKKAMALYAELLSTGSVPLELLLKKYDIPISGLFDVIVI